MILVARTQSILAKEVLVRWKDSDGFTWMLPGILKAVEPIGRSGSGSYGKWSATIVWNVNGEEHEASHVVQGSIEELNQKGVFFRNDGVFAAGKVPKPPREVAIKHFE